MGSFWVSVISGAGREVVVRGSDGGGGGGGWDMRVLLFGRARTRCTKPHWDDVCVQFGGSFQIGSSREWCSVGQDVRNGGTASSVAALVVYSLMSLVGDPVRIWIASSQIDGRMLGFSNGDVEVEAL
jgi:hypothetical protein